MAGDREDSNNKNEAEKQAGDESMTGEQRGEEGMQRVAVLREKRQGLRVDRGS